MYQSFLHYRGARYLWVALVLAAVAAVAYAAFNPGVPRNGGTAYGFTSGILAALLIVWLTLYGVRKRSYTVSATRASGWLSAHVYLGASLLVLATLHSAGQIGWNIHSTAYVLMVIVIFSGFYGVYVYRRMPMLLMRNRGGRSREVFLQELAAVDSECRALAATALPKIQAVVSSALESTVLGGRAWSLLTERDESTVELPDASGRMQRAPNPGQQRMLEFLAGQLAASPGGRDAEVLQKLVNLFSQRKAIADVVMHDLWLQSRLRLWLFVHVPLTFGLWGTLIAHIVSVFAYW